MSDPLLRAFVADDIVRDTSHRKECPNVLPGAACVDPGCIYCTYCKIADAEEPRRQVVADPGNAGLAIARLAYPDAEFVQRTAPQDMEPDHAPAREANH